MKQLIAFIFLLFTSHAVQAQVYKCENNMGEINFSDEPCSRGETSTRLNGIKSTPSSKQKKQSSRSVQTKKTAKKARKNNEAYVLLSLLTTTQLELETATLRSSLADETTESPELLLPDGITVDLLKVDKILLSRTQTSKSKLKAQFIMNDGFKQEIFIKKPYPVISGEAKIGRFSKSLGDIKVIEFFNSKKLLKARSNKKIVQKESKKTTTANKKPKPPAQNETPVIELDLSNEIKPSSVSKPEIKVVSGKNSPTKKPTSIKKASSKIQVDFVNEKKAWLNKSSLGSSRNNNQANGHKFILNDSEHIPYDKIKSIRVRPTSDKSRLVVAVALKNGEIKMENMSQPFTRVLGNTGSGSFDHSLLDIKSISFQR